MATLVGQDGSSFVNPVPITPWQTSGNAISSLAPAQFPGIAGTAVTAFIYVASTFTANTAKVCLYDSGGNLVAVSAPIDVTSVGLKSAAISAAITAQNYGVIVVPDTGSFGVIADSGSNAFFDRQWTAAHFPYASPPSVLPAPDVANGQQFIVFITDGKTLAGQTIAATPGNLAPSVSAPLTGLTIAVTAGTLTPFGNQTPQQQGFIRTPGPGVEPFSNRQFVSKPFGYTFGTSVQLTGQTIAATAGNLGPAESVPLTGASMAATPGNVGVNQGIIVALVGQSFAASAGSLGTPSVSVALTGQTITCSGGSIGSTSGFRVMATQIGQYNEVLYGPGDVFDIFSANDFSDSSVDYLIGKAGGPYFGWMKRVPPGTPVTDPTQPIKDNVPNPRRIIF